jgi:DegV family protein with EDD domain
MSIKIVADSACDIHSLEHVDFETAPLHIIVGDKVFVDDANLDTTVMQQALDDYNDKTSTACPAPGDWITAFGDADYIFCTTITGHLSGSYNSAMIAKKMYEEEHPGRKVHVLDTLSTGPEITLIIFELQRLVMEGLDHEEILKKIVMYMNHTHLYYSLTTVNNLARNGRVNPLIAKGIGILGIRIIGLASDEGTLQIVDRARGDKKAMCTLIKHLKKAGYTDGKVIIGHNNNPEAAAYLAKKLEEAFGTSNCRIQTTGGLDSYYAEPGSILIAFEA